MYTEDFATHLQTHCIFIVSFGIKIGCKGLQAPSIVDIITSFCRVMLCCNVTVMRIRVIRSDPYHFKHLDPDPAIQPG